MLVDEGKLEWDMPVRKFVPEFLLHDSVASDRVTIVDMLSHRTGLPRHDFVWINDGFTYEQILDRLPFLELSKDLRQEFQYCNLMYLAASVVIECLSGMSYNQFIQTRIFNPLTMNDADFSLTDMQKTPDFAKPYKEHDGQLVELEFIDNDVASGAGCINASIDDMGKWLRFHLKKGKVGETQVVSSDNLKKTHDPVVVVSAGSSFDYWIPDQQWIKLQTYGLGWAGEIYRGYSVVYHEGGIDGSTSKMCFLPDEGVGVGVIVNKTDSFLPVVVTYHLLDRILGLEPVDWNTMLKSIDDNVKKIPAESGAQSQELRIADTHPAHPLTEYAGTYHHPGYGDIEICCEHDALTVHLGGAVSPLHHYHYEAFHFEYSRFEWEGLLNFQTDSSGDVVGFTVKLESFVAPIRFDRLPDSRLRDRAVLEPLTGTYDLAGATVTIALKENVLTCAMPNESARELVPIRGLRFKIKGSEAATITFKHDTSGTVDRFLYSQLGAVVLAKKVV
jgi:CubicO group peptidase (beta-lactamase class C family)